MQFKQRVISQYLYLISLTIFPFICFSQTTYLPEGSREYILLERLEILSQKDSILNFSKIKPFSRKQFIPVIESYGRLQGSETPSLSKVDMANISSALAKNNEWTEEQQSSRKTFLKRFYRTPANLYEVKTNDFILTVNPVFQYYLGKEKDNDEHIFLNTRGAALRGRIANKIGFAAYITDNQERDPIYVQQYVKAKKAVPGQGFYKDFKKTGYDYFDARGYITFNATRYIDFQFGYDKNFIGNGYRSLLLSDISSPYLFFKINTRIWRFNYQNLFIELNSAQRLNADQLFPKKYAAIHHLDMGITKWLNLGLFEGVVFGRVNHFEFGYLNPIIFYRSIEQQNGSIDNAVIGFDAKANVAKRFQFYGQLLVDEFNFEEIKRAKGWWGNKYGWQVGAKYINAFQIKNLDLQIESNRVRPFTYSHRDSVANYTHYNQPLAHPLGANFQEWIGIARYQPANKWLLEAKAFYMYRGKDSGNVSFGGNIFLPNVPPYRKNDFGYEVGSGVESKTGLASFLISYELKPNFFIEANTVYRKEGATVIDGSKSTFIFYGGIRWNMHRRDFEF
ncbi:MAG: capsule assembly Wzi family protein [Flavisolibacter sp.]|jgi:hypothetical protein